MSPARAQNAVCFDEAKKNVNQYREWKQMILHQFSLLHALSMQCLRLDDSLDNLVVFNRFEGYAGTTTASRDISLSEREAVRAVRRDAARRFTSAACARFVSVRKRYQLDRLELHVQIRGRRADNQDGVGRPEF